MHSLQGANHSHLAQLVPSGSCLLETALEIVSPRKSLKTPSVLPWWKHLSGRLKVKEYREDPLSLCFSYGSPGGGEPTGDSTESGRCLVSHFNNNSNKVGKRPELAVVPQSWSAARKPSTFSRNLPLLVLKLPDVNCVMDTFKYKNWNIF